MVTFHIIHWKKNKHNPGFVVNMFKHRPCPKKKHIIHIPLHFYWNLLMLIFLEITKKKHGDLPGLTEPSLMILVELRDTMCADLKGSKI